MEPVTRFEYKVKRFQLLTELDFLKGKLEEYADEKHGSVSGWQILREDECTSILKAERERFLNHYDIMCQSRARYYILQPDIALPPHIDYNTTCSINFVLSGDESPVSYESGDYHYTQAVLDTTKMHWVNNSSKPRILFKISIFNRSYDEVKCSIQK